MTKNDDKVTSEAGVVRREFIDDQLLDQLLASSSERGLALTGEGGLPELTSRRCWNAGCGPS